MNAFEELVVSNADLNDVSRLRETLLQQGYLFFRDYFDPGALNAIRTDMLQTADRHGIVMPGTPLSDGIFAGGEIPSSYRFEASPLYRDMLGLDSFNRFGRQPSLLLLFAGLLEGPVQEHRRRIARITFPGSFKNTTPIHQDFFYIKGTENTFTCWIPCGDCPSELGGLAVLEGSHRLGFLPHIPMQGTGGNGIDSEQPELQGLKWRSIDYRVGDLLLFHGLTVHKALHNVTPDRLRLSLEYRYQRQGDRIDEGSLRSHYAGS